jgi:LysR family pca operon transcriptional activator
MARHLEQRLKLRQLRIASTIATHGSIGKAARAIGLAQPSVTKSLHDLETSLGLQLFVRSPRGIEPTAAGLVVVEAAERILGELSRLDDALNDHSAVAAGRVAIGTSPAAAASLVPHALAALRGSGGGPCVEITEGESDFLLAALTSGTVDLVIGDLLSTGAPDGLRRRILCEDEAVLVARADHPLFDGEITARAAAAFDLVVPTARRHFGQQTADALSGLPDYRPRILPSTSLGFAREMIRTTNVVALASRLMLSSDLMQGLIRVLPLPLGSARVPFGIVYRSDAALPKPLAGFVRCLRDTLDSLVRAGAGATHKP